MKRLAVFVSGSGTNLENLAQKIEEGKLKGCKIALVISDDAEAYALKRAKRLNLDSVVVKRTDYKTKADFEGKIREHLQKAGIDYVILAGFMRILSPAFVAAYRWRVINIHPALLPNFQGPHAIKDAWEANAKESGATVHFVDEDVDSGPTILQGKVKREAGDTIEQFEQKIHQVEYEIYPKAIQLLVDGKLEVKDHKVLMKQSG